MDALDWTPIAAGILGGVGLFLLGMRLMTDGLKLAAGHALRRILERGTATRGRAVLSGILITSLVQSSSAVTVAVIGFANAGLLSLAGAVAVIYGSNVGTTTTGWLVALVGFHVNVKAFALPAIGLGMALRLAGGRRGGPLGEALAGFGLFFLGIDVLKTALDGVQTALPLGSLDALRVTGVAGALLYTAVGFGLTLVMQSSSAALAIVLTSVGGGVVPIGAGACLVIGANVGTTSTAALAVLGATSNAKRVAAAHVVFNVLTGAVALALLPLLLLGIERFRTELGLDAEPAAVVAGFHTLFNLLGVALLLPLTGRLVEALAQRFRTPEEDEARPRYLDRNVLSTPVLAMGALGLELARIGRIAREIARDALLLRGAAPRLAQRREGLGQLLEATGDFVTSLQRTRLPEELDRALPAALRVGRYYAEIAQLAQEIAENPVPRDALAVDLRRAVERFEMEVVALLEATAVDLPGTSEEAATRALAAAQAHYQELKATLLRAGAEGRVPVHDLVTLLDQQSNVRRLCDQAERGARHLRGLGELAASGTAPEVSADPMA